MPSPEALKALVSHVMTEKRDKDDVSNIWQQTWANHVEKHGYVVGTNNPAHLIGLCHGDDFVVAACEDETDMFEGILADKFEFLHRNVRINPDGAMEIEADTKHVPNLLKEFGLERGNSVTKPRVKLSQTEATKPKAKECPMSSPTLATLFRSGTMRAAHSGQNSVDIQYAPQDATPSLRIFVDSDRAGDPVSRRSTTGKRVMRGVHLIWHSRTVQQVLGLS
eukprot:2370107-Amphidinium_carterae.1